MTDTEKVELQQAGDRLRQICFMVMPFGTKPTGGKEGPNEIDFDHLWLQALKPAIESVGYHAVRSDQDLGPVIIKEMLERLVASDLVIADISIPNVIADISIPNANVYYEVGIRHAAKSCGCVLIGAEWAKPLFDIQQMTRIRYTLSSKQASPEECEIIRRVLGMTLPNVAQQLSPLKSLIPSYPKVDPGVLESFRDDLNDFYRLQAETQEIRERSSEVRAQAISRLTSKISSQKCPSPSAALEAIHLLRDCCQWKELVEFAAQLPSEVRELQIVQEQVALALSNGGDDQQAVAKLKTLIHRYGPTPERLGLLGGRYKRLYRNNKNPSMLDLAIGAYERGFRLDLNAYYPGCNLPGLLRERNRAGDKERAKSVSIIIREACQTAREIGTCDKWLNQTLLTLAFETGDLALASRCVNAIRVEGHAVWELETTFTDLVSSVCRMTEGSKQTKFEGILAEMKALLHQASA